MAESEVKGQFFNSAAGSFPCSETIDALNNFYTYTKIQPGNDYPASEAAMEKMRLSKSRWAEALNVLPCELGFGPSTTQNIYILAQAFSEHLKSGDEIVVTNQDHESNTGIMRRLCEARGIVIREWSVNSVSGQLELASLEPLLNAKTRLVCFPHASNIIGQKNDARAIIQMAKAYGAHTLVDGVAYVPHAIPDVTSLGADIYLFSLYKVYSVHLGVMIVKQALLEQLPAQGHYFKRQIDVSERLIPAGPDHAQIGAAGAVLEYIETLATHHGDTVDSLRENCELVSSLWRGHEFMLVKTLLGGLESMPGIRVIGSSEASEDRCPIVSVSPLAESPIDLAHMLGDQGILSSAGHYYSPRLLEAVGIDPNRGVVRFSMAHYNSHTDVECLINNLGSLL